MALRTPLYDWHVVHGARLVEFGGWDMPVQYTTITEEHQAVRTAAGLFDISHMGRLVFQGPQAEPFVQHLFTNDTATMKPGQVRYGLVCNEEGGILDDVLVYKLDSVWLMVVNASNREKILGWIGKHQQRFDCRCEDRTAAWAMLAIQGPQVHRLMQVVAPQVLGLKYYHATTTAGPDRSHIWSRTGYTGEDGWEVILPAAQVALLADRLMNEVAPQAGVQLKPCGLGARDTLRLEAAMPLYGHELSEHIDPFQAGLAWAVKPNKGPFLGRDALQRHHQQPNRRQRVGLELKGKRIAREGAAVKARGKDVGQVTSGTFSPTLNKAIAMAYVDAAAATVGTGCEVDIRGKTEVAEVVPLPFYQRSK
jgi:aminomethyltransferase